jgi:Anti-sigma-K factor rskA
MVPHPDPDDLALVALGEQLDGSVDAHIAGCEVCRADLAALREAVDLAQLSNFGEDATPPDDYVWDAIAEELGFAEAAAPAALNGSAATQEDPLPDLADEPAPASRPAAHTAKPVEADDAGAPALTALPGGVDRPSDRRPSTGSSGSGVRRSRWIAVLAAAVIGVALGAGGYALFSSRTQSVDVEATAGLTPVPGGPLPESDGQLGTADLVAAQAGQEVRVTAPDLPAIGGAYEVWLFGNEGRMISLGSLNQGQGTFVVPQGIDTQEYRTVDISDEAPDGNPAHSGISVVRGQFS